MGTPMLLRYTNEEIQGAELFAREALDGGLGDFQKTLDRTPDPVGDLIKAEQNKRFRITEIDPPHTDGVETEILGKATWKHYWEGGQLVKSETWDPDLPGGYLLIDT